MEYLNYFQQNPRLNLTNLFETPNTPLKEEEIKLLEQKWNNNQPFPIVVKEFLSIGGSYNWIFEGGDQESMRNTILSLSKIINYRITRPFVAINTSISDPQYFIIFLDENQIDPIVYELNLYTDIELEHYECPRLEQTDIKLSDYLNGAVESFRLWQEKGLI